jgi:hypothetical protein
MYLNLSVYNSTLPFICLNNIVVGCTYIDQPSIGPLWARYWNFGFHRRRESVDRRGDRVTYIGHIRRLRALNCTGIEITATYIFHSPFCSQLALPKARRYGRIPLVSNSCRMCRRVYHVSVLYFTCISSVICWLSSSWKYSLHVFKVP